jgi:putative component of membrane protein insertase Oxa1/YidC/SpoIIIJ protein YidD
MSGIKRRLFFQNNSAPPAETMGFDVPSEAEQREARDYVCRRVINRPDTDIKKAVIYSAAFFVITQTLAVFLWLLLGHIFFYLKVWFNTPPNLRFTPCSSEAHFPPPFFLYPVAAICCFFGGLTVCLKKAIIGMVKLYQHYAPEKMRRKCLFKPTCSEYMILAIEKNGVSKGTYQGLRRLFIKCKGRYYSIDYPAGFK